MAESQADLEKVVKKLNVENEKAMKKQTEVAATKDSCIKDSTSIGIFRAECEKDLSAALPILKKAIKAADSISKKDVIDLKTNKKPGDIIRIVIDGILILRSYSVEKVSAKKLYIKKEDVDFISDSYDAHGGPMLSEMTFLKDLM